ncbi:aldehyde dehydrogenase family protein [Xylophilus rhododendri]|uniref:Aldehyde dehydrogenase family protein n=1 Tax=Xylophilus rhododendri TaxID=2697032 RepID=A0A857J331_9BURK|nr:aldehyde dehydrogenase [Xylophilus rhododendri]QHI97452.1 aldehyde dehydrogenase family protein [Xylophilus rhododendri]
MTRKYQLYIAGRYVAPLSGRMLPSVNPYTGQVWAEIPDADAADVAAAVEAAQRAYRDTWRHTPGIARAALMLKLAQLIEAAAERMSILESSDNGKIVRETQPQMKWVGRQLRFFAGYADKLFGQQIPLDQAQVLDYLVREPYGVVALITAWNSPLALLANKLAPALAAGNCVVVKPSEHASVSTLEFAALVEEAGFPPGVFNVITGGADAGRALVEAPGVMRVSFTGSPGVGREIAAAAGRRLVPVTLELGGKSPNIVFDDADLDKAVVGALAGIFGATGQTCVAGSRLLVQRPVYEEVVQRVAERAAKIRMGDPVDPQTEMGTVANEPQFRRILSAIEGARASGARLMTGGARATGPGLDSGYFVQPTVFADVDNRSHLAQEEIFGPVLAAIPFDTEAEAVAMANDSRYGLAAGIWSRDIGRVMRVSGAMQAGSVWVNTYRAVAAQAPFGGFKESGIGRERGEAGLLEYMTTRNVMIDYSDAERDPFAIKS